MLQPPTWLQYKNQNAIRNDPLNPQLVKALESVLPELGVTMEVFSGGQEPSGPNRTGSTRHNHGNAADVFFYKDGRKLDWSNPKDVPVFQEIVRRGKAAGITGFGAGEGYMQPGSMHVGFGNPAVWGAGGKGANAPDWLTAAYNGAPAVQAQASMQPPRPMARPQPPAPMGTAMGGFMGGPRQVAARQPDVQIQPAVGSTTADFRPTRFQQDMARQAFNGDPSQLARILEATGLDPTGKKRLNPRGMNNPGILAMLQGKMNSPKIPAAGGGLGGGILGKIFGLFG